MIETGKTRIIKAVGAAAIVAAANFSFLSGCHSQKAGLEARAEGVQQLTHKKGSFASTFEYDYRGAGSDVKIYGVGLSMYFDGFGAEDEPLPKKDVYVVLDLRNVENVDFDNFRKKNFLEMARKGVKGISKRQVLVYITERANQRIDSDEELRKKVLEKVSEEFEWRVVSENSELEELMQGDSLRQLLPQRKNPSKKGLLYYSPEENRIRALGDK